MHKQEDNVHVARFGPEGSGDGRESIAAVLRRARENHGQDVRSVAQVLRIRQVYLEALESGAFDKLPGTAYALGFLRTYAEYLGLNANDMVDRFKDEAQAPEPRTELIFPEPVVEGRIPGGAIILISVVLLVAAYGGWFYLTNQGRSVADLIPSVPERIQTFLGGGSAETAPPAAADPALAAIVKTEAPAGKTEEEPAKASAQLAPPPAKPVPAPEVVSEAAPTLTETPSQVATQPDPLEAVPNPAESTQISALPDGREPGGETARDTGDSVYDGPPLSAEPAPELEALSRADAPVAAPVQSRDEPMVQQTVVIPAPPSAPQDFAPPGERAPQVYGEGNQDSRIVLRALQDSWVQIRDSQDGLLLTRVLRSGDTYHVPDRSGLTLLTGNAGGIELEVDGIRLTPLGPVGAVRRQIALDPTILLSKGTRQ